MSPARTPKKRPAPVTRDEIVTASLAIIDAEGLDALSMRRLARDLGIEAMSLYHHFPNKDAILDAVVAAMIRQMTLPDPMPSSWVDQLVELIDAFRRALVAHPNAVPVMLTRPLAPPEDAMLTPVTVLQSQGFEPDRMLELYQSLMALTFGHAFVTSSAARHADAPVLGDDGFRRAARILIEGYASAYEGPPGS